MFLDLAVLVNEQGTILNSIEQHVDKAAIYTEKTVKDVVKAKDYNSKSRWKMCMIFVILIIVVAVILAPTLSLLKA